ncbi:MAG: phenylalanine--tRNA ligase subunit alpha [Planctomycetia bacterium TMED53]|nr:MAG: phenylalanine--tRNA ligase subunit alpha [Planctomycetia bacterium TMED53]
MNQNGSFSDLDAIENEALAAIEAAADAAALDHVRIQVLGKKGSLKQILRNLGGLTAEERPLFGARANVVKEKVQAALEEARGRLGSAPSSSAKNPGADLTLPGKMPERGSRHPVRLVSARMIKIFASLGFEVADGPEVEDEWHNFTGLNIPADHIARDPAENFYLEDDLLMRSQTSTVQVRVMENTPPPLRIIAPGKVFRPDTVDATHSYMFHQLEGLVVDEGVTFGHLKSTLLTFFQQLLQDENMKLRLRPSFFPFTEPSAEVDLFWRGGWMEMGGCGMVDPNVLEAVGIDPEKYTGFAFGLGIERVTMASYNIPDIRYFTENDVRFLSQFS